jgi:hypothetical protein
VTEYTGCLSADLHHAVVRDEVTLLTIGYMISRILATVSHAQYDA